MNALLALSIMASSLSTEPEPLAFETIVSRYEAECAKGADGADCDALRVALEDRLFEDIVTIVTSRGTVDQQTLHVAARARTPWIAAYAVALLGTAYTVADEPYVRTALDSPYPILRMAASEVGYRGGDDRLRARAERARHALDRSPSAKESPLLPDPVPDAGALGGPIYPGASYSHLASSPAQPVFTTADPPEKVVAFYAKGKKAYTAAEMKAAGEARRAKAEAEQEAVENDMAAAMAKAAAMMQAMNAGKDPMQAMQELGKAEEAKSHDWTEEIADLEGIVSPRFVVVEETMGAPTRVVAIYTDNALGATAFAYLGLPDRGQAAELMKDSGALERWSRWQAVLGP